MKNLDLQKMPKWIYQDLEKNPGVLCVDKGRGEIGDDTLASEAAILATSYLKNPRSILVIKKNQYHAQLLYDRLIGYLNESSCYLFGVDESLRVEAIASSPETMANKVDTLASLYFDPKKVIITSPAGVMRLLPKKETFGKGCIKLEVNQVVEMDDLQRALQAGGYFKTSHIDQPLSYASRGGIVDVYSINYENPIRIEFFDNEIDSIRFFDITTQKTIRTIPSVQIVPASDLLLEEEELEVLEQKVKEALKDSQNPILEANVLNDVTLLKEGVRSGSLYPYLCFLDENGSIFDYLENPTVVCCDKSGIQEGKKRYQQDIVAYMQEMVQENKLLPRFAIYHDMDRMMDKYHTVNFEPFTTNNTGLYEITLPKASLKDKIAFFPEGTTLLFALNQHELNRFMESAKLEDISYSYIQDEDELNGLINLTCCEINQGFYDEKNHFAIISAYELYEMRKVSSRYAKKFQAAEVLNNFEELQVGDYLVHAEYGVGQYLGIDTREIQGVKKDFLKIVYRGNAELLVPLEQFRLVRKFVSREGYVPKLNKLGTKEWQKTKQKLEENVDDLAKRLVDLYANRTEEIGYAFAKDSELQKEFEDGFEYELTPDQKSAVADVKKDMEASKPMDRLVCGDVGFGKTEIAIRAAFKAAAENKQVAILCPTTILAEQHYHTFLKRFENYPFTIKVLDRFVKPNDVKTTLKELENGHVDIIIGTHRILSKDVVFHDLGLLVIDEEQRFGVEHKERIKEYKNNIDVLTLSATPIPRTLQMSLVGIRSLSQLETPPTNRYNVLTYVVEKNDGLVIDAIEKELARHGQVFYLFNRVDQIYQVARKLQENIVGAKVGVVHGQMDRDTIEDMMYRFTNHELNILVCTTIIENGIDIPNANTILIEDAQNFGLAQIYQIKGRVGRSDRVAYAYLLVPESKQLSEQATKRLQAVKEFATLGSGYKIAMRDLTIRGAGDLLGPSQSGFIDTVGIDMYMEMLEEAIKKQKGIPIEKKEVIKPIQSKLNSFIPKEFAPDDFDKISIYQTIEKISSLEELASYQETILDQYGSFPKEVDALFAKKKLSILVHEDHVLSYKETPTSHEVVFTKEFSSRVDGVKMFEDFIEISRDIQLRYTKGCIVAEIPNCSDALSLACEVIQQARKAEKDEN